MLMTAPAPAERPNTWRGGTVLQCNTFGETQEFAEIWTVDPRDGSERVITVHVEGELPTPGDTLAWHYEHSPAWWPKGANARRCFLPRVGRSFDPYLRTPSTALHPAEKKTRR